MTGTHTDLLAECKALGIRLTVAGDGGLSIDAPQDALTPDLLDRLKAHKAELLASIERFDERAAIMEFDASLSRPEAERLAWKECFT
jgi:TubC N-terminal docking domain